MPSVAISRRSRQTGAPITSADLDIVQRLSIKEEPISALTHTHLPLREIAVTREGSGFRLQVPDAAIEVEAISSRIEGHYLSLARARRAL